MSAPGVIIAAPASGSGKTVLTLGLLRAFRRQKLKVGSFKVGPDYIDPAFHAAAGGGSSCNLDVWAMRIETLAGLSDQIAQDFDLVVGEGVMGLFDGASSGEGSTADLASLFDLPVVLAVDAKGMGSSVAALLEGFVRHRDDVEIAGVIFNRIGSAAHEAVLRRACSNPLLPPVIGCVPRDQRLALPARHLGLVQAGEHATLDDFLDQAADVIETHLDLGRLQSIARPFSLGLFGQAPTPLLPLGQRIAVAADEAFAFAYDAILDGWRALGAEIIRFSPLADQAPDPAADAVFLPGGYPELHAGRLAGNQHLLNGLRHAAARGCFVYGECGGYMVLGQSLTDQGGETHPMAGLLPVSASFKQATCHLGYRALKLLANSPLGEPGTTFRGHEFHYAVEERNPATDALFDGHDASHRSLGALGAVEGTVAGSFVHLIDRVADASTLDLRMHYLRPTDA